MRNIQKPYSYWDDLLVYSNKSFFLKMTFIWWKTLLSSDFGLLPLEPPLNFIFGMSFSLRNNLSYLLECEMLNLPYCYPLLLSKNNLVKAYLCPFAKLFYDKHPLIELLSHKSQHFFLHFNYYITPENCDWLFTPWAKAGPSHTQWMWRTTSSIKAPKKVHQFNSIWQWCEFLGPIIILFFNLHHFC